MTASTSTTVPTDPSPLDPHPGTVLVTGATRGLGAETARRLAGLGWTVWLAARDVDAAARVADRIRTEHPDADLRPVALDVTDDASVATAYETVRSSGTGLDALVNNAGIAGEHRTTPETVPGDFLPVYGVNVLGPVRVTHAFLPLLTASPRARLVMVSSGLGRYARLDDPTRPEHGVPGMVYQSSKAALDLIAHQYAAALPDVRVCSVDPGYTATDLNGHSGPQTVQEGTDAIVHAVAGAQIPGLLFDREDLPVSA